MLLRVGTHRDVVMENEFVSETIKEKPVNTKKLARRTFFVSIMAVVFGLVACITFLVLEPVISNILYPEEIKQVEIPDQQEEVEPAKLLTEKEAEKEMAEAAKEAAISAIEDAQANDDAAVGGIEAYNALYEQLYEVSKESSVSIVQVTGVSVETDWFLDTVESEKHVAGLIIADNGQQLLILADASGMPDVNQLSVTFYDGTVASAALLSQDEQTGLGIYTVLRGDLSLDTRAGLAYAKLGVSVGEGIVGKPMIAIGSPNGDFGSMCYGMITSVGTTLKLADATYRVLCSDVYGGNNMSGVFINTKGEVIAIMTNSCTKNAGGQLICAIGISALKPLIEKLSNNEELCYAGIYGMDVTQSAHFELGVPYGGYVTYVEPESPAMNMGVIKGDVITKMNGKDITTFWDYQNGLSQMKPGDTLTLSIYRYSAGQYVEIPLQGIVQTKEKQ